MNINYKTSGSFALSFGAKHLVRTYNGTGICGPFHQKIVSVKLVVSHTK